MVSGSGFLRVDFCFIVAGGIADAAGVNRGLEVEIAQFCGDFKLRQQFFHGMAECAVFLVNRSGRAGGHGHQQLLTAQLALRAVRETVQEYLVEPQFHQTRHGVPGKRKLPHDHVGLEQCCLLGGDVELVVGIECVQTADFRLGQYLGDFIQDDGVG